MNDSDYLRLCGILFLSGGFLLGFSVIAGKRGWQKLSTVSGMYGALMFASSIGGFGMSALKTTLIFLGIL